MLPAENIYYHLTPSLTIAKRRRSRRDCVKAPAILARIYEPRERGGGSNRSRVQSNIVLRRACVRGPLTELCQRTLRGPSEVKSIVRNDGRPPVEMVFASGAVTPRLRPESRCCRDARREDADWSRLVRGKTLFMSNCGQGYCVYLSNMNNRLSLNVNI